jgi:hypothetical protein
MSYAEEPAACVRVVEVPVVSGGMGSLQRQQVAFAGVEDGGDGGTASLVC